MVFIIIVIIVILLLLIIIIDLLFVENGSIDPPLPHLPSFLQARLSLAVNLCLPPCLKFKMLPLLSYDSTPCPSAVLFCICLRVSVLWVSLVHHKQFINTKLINCAVFNKIVLKKKLQKGEWGTALNTLCPFCMVVGDQTIIL